jgi:mRNA-degrading endonuclease toxin of MazEF toxin-antitoxin module
MKTFDVFNCQPPDWKEPHPAVIVSHPDRSARKPVVEVIMCSTARANRSPEPGEILLDKEDGLDWETICFCDLIYAVRRDDLKARRGEVSEARRGHLVRTIIAAHRWADVL